MVMIPAETILMAEQEAKDRAAARPSWTCGARAQGTAGGNDPADCDWPTCGCDPHATKVIEALIEQGHLQSDHR